MARFLIIVSPQQPRLHAHLTQVFGDNGRVEVVYDRRTGQRPPPADAERRQRDVSASLDGLGWAIVVRPDAPAGDPRPPSVLEAACPLPSDSIAAGPLAPTAHS